MHQNFPGEYDFAPRTWTLPTDYGAFVRHCSAHPNQIFINKPENGAQGRGISLLRGKRTLGPTDRGVVQEYIDRPLLLDGFKVDFRLYVLVTSVAPFRIFLHDNGLARLATVPYEAPNPKNLQQSMLHLTNYSLNKSSANFKETDAEHTGHKRSFAWVLRWLKQSGYNVVKIMVKTFPILQL